MASTPAVSPVAGPPSSSPAIESTIEKCLQHFEYADAISLAELYYSQTKSDTACHLLAKSLHINGLTSYAGDVIRNHGPKTSELRYLLARIAYETKNYIEAEKLLAAKVKAIMRGEAPDIHPELKDTEQEPFAHSLLAAVYSCRDTHRAAFSARHYQRSLVAMPMRLSTIKKYSEYGGSHIGDAMKGLDIRVDHKSRTSRVSSSDSGEREQHRYMTRQRTRHSQSGRVPSPREKEKQINALFNEDRPKPLSPRRSHGSPLSAINSSTPTLNSNPIITLFGGDDSSEPMDVENHGPRNRPPLADVDENRENRDDVHEELHGYMTEFANIITLLNGFKLDEAIASIDALSTSRKELPLTLEYLGRTLVEKVDYRQACGVFAKLHEKFPYHVDGMDYFSTALWQLGQGRPLSILARELTDKARHRAEAWIVAGNLYSTEKQSPTSIECLDRATRLYPQNGYAHYLLGSELIEVGHYDRAEQVFIEAQPLAPHEYRPYAGLGQIELKRARGLRAVDYQKEACKRNPTNVVLQSQLALAYLGLKRNDQDLKAVQTAIKILANAIKLDPQNMRTRYHYAKALFDCQRYKDAEEELEQLQHLHPKESHVHRLLMRCQRKLGDKQKAKINEILSTHHEEVAVGDHPLEEEDIEVDVQVPAIGNNQQNQQNIQQQLPQQPPPPPPQQQQQQQ